MRRRGSNFSRQLDRLQAYLDGLTRVAGHVDRVIPVENYTKGLMLLIERKSVEPMVLLEQVRRQVLRSQIFNNLARQ
jgi:SRSO17 transposase